MTRDELQHHMFATYTTLRIGLAIIAFAFPILLWLGGRLVGLPLQDSMSAYYHAYAADGQSMRNWFVGILFAVGVILYLYKGYSYRENYALNLAGIFAIGIAVFPMQWNCGDACSTFSLHGTFAALFFLAIAYVCFWCASDTLHLMKNPAREKWYRAIYRLIGIGLILTPVVALLLTLVLDQFKSFVFYGEMIGIFVFSAYWLVKSIEITTTHAETQALTKTADI